MFLVFDDAMKTADAPEGDSSATLGQDDTLELVASSSGLCTHQSDAADLDGTISGPPEPLMASSPTRGATREEITTETELPCASVASACQPASTTAEMDQERGKL